MIAYVVTGASWFQSKLQCSNVASHKCQVIFKLKIATFKLLLRF